jgi:hypothetical protein
MFSQQILPVSFTFNQLTDSLPFEEIITGRVASNMVSSATTIPIVRTTTRYTNPAKLFNESYQQLRAEIQKMDSRLTFNTAMIEIYDDRYKTMRYHSDQALDLAENSYICIYTCYENNPLAKDMRHIAIQNKETKQKRIITLNNNSITYFSTNDNKTNLHKIFLNGTSKNKWLGVTFRLSKTFVKFIDEIPYFVCGDEERKQLVMASEEQRLEFVKCKNGENIKIDFVYPQLVQTLSPHDLLMPVV